MYDADTTGHHLLAERGLIRFALYDAYQRVYARKQGMQTYSKHVISDHQVMATNWGKVMSFDQGIAKDVEIEALYLGEKLMRPIENSNDKYCVTPASCERDEDRTTNVNPSHQAKER